MEPLFILVGTLILLYYGFVIYCRYKSVELHDLAKKVFLDLTPVLYTEKDGNTLYLYDKKTNVFQCQAFSLEDLAKEYSSVRKVWIAKVLHDNKELWFVEGDVLDTIEIVTEVKDTK